MFKVILSVIFALLIGTQTVQAANSVSTTNLTPTQKAEIQLQISRLVEENALTSTNIPDIATAAKVSQWVNIGSDIGKGLAGAAKELGIAANEFAGTGVGVFTMFLIGYHFIGAAIVGIVFGLLWLMFTIPAWIWMYRGQFIIESITTYDKGKGPDGKRKHIEYKANTDANDGKKFIFGLMLILIIIVGVMSIF